MNTQAVVTVGTARAFTWCVVDTPSVGAAIVRCADLAGSESVAYAHLQVGDHRRDITESVRALLSWRASVRRITFTTVED